MDLKEVFETITATEKWYADIPVGSGYMTAQHANRIKARFKAGTLSFCTLRIVFSHFGYAVVQTKETKVARV